jgi:hypothetical protein
MSIKTLNPSTAVLNFAEEPGPSSKNSISLEDQTLALSRFQITNSQKSKIEIIIQVLKLPPLESYPLLLIQILNLN